MIIEKDGKTTSINAEVWSDDIRIYTDAKEIIRPKGVFLCNGRVSSDEHCDRLMDAISMCKDRDVLVGMVVTDKTSNREVLKSCALSRNIEDCVFSEMPTDGEYTILDTVDLPSETMSAYYFAKADRMCGNTTSEICELIVQCVEDIR